MLPQTEEDALITVASTVLFAVGMCVFCVPSVLLRLVEALEISVAQGYRSPITVGLGRSVRFSLVEHDGPEILQRGE